MFVLGIDPGITRCGYGCVERASGSDLRAVAAGVLTTPRDDALPARLATLQADLAALMGELQPDVVVVERVLFSANVRTAMATGQASGLALAEAHRRGCEVATYSPNEVKLAVAGDGAADKAQVQRMVAMLLHLPEVPKPADAADALALALTHLAGAGLRARAGTAATIGGPAVIGSLRGTLLDRQPARTGGGAEVTVEVGGVGYRVTVAPGAVGLLGDTGGPVFLHIHTHVREDALLLYGFPSRDERTVFEALLGAPGIGPSVALAILSVHSPTALRRIARTDDADALCLVPGIGKKTSAKLLLELKSRLGADDDADGPALRVVGPDGDVGRSAHAEVRAALSGLGYAPDEVASAVRTLPEDGAVDDLLRAALRSLAMAR